MEIRRQQAKRRMATCTRVRTGTFTKTPAVAGRRREATVAGLQCARRTRRIDRRQLRLIRNPRAAIRCKACNKMRKTESGASNPANAIRNSARAADGAAGAVTAAGAADDGNGLNKETPNEYWTRKKSGEPAL